MIWALLALGLLALGVGYAVGRYIGWADGWEDGHRDGVREVERRVRELATRRPEARRRQQEIADLERQYRMPMWRNL